MSDPYIPNTPATPKPGADRQGNATRPVQPSVSVNQSGGFGMGAMLAIVLVIVAILAAVFFYQSNGADTDAPAVTIENDNGTAPATPDAAPIDPAAPAATAPDAATPEAATPDATAPADGAAPVVPATPPAP